MCTPRGSKCLLSRTAESRFHPQSFHRGKILVALAWQIGTEMLNEYAIVF